MLRRTACLLIGLLLAMPAVSAGAAAAGPQVMPPADVRTGMKGYGMTTLKGMRPERFEFEVLGRMAGYFPKGDLVLIRMSGPVIDEAGIIAGMSGSPVYIDGKLLGAVAYGWTFTSIPLAGVTPFVDMLTVREIDRRADADAREQARRVQRERARGLAAPVSSPPGDGGLRAAVQEAAVRLMVPPLTTVFATPSGGAAPAGLLPAGVDPLIQPLPMPLGMTGGLAADSFVRSMLDGSGFLPVQVTGTGAAEAPDLEPGMTVGAGLITGDMDVCGMGTLTWFDDEHALAFGHPMFGGGQADYPLVLGEVQAIVPSSMRSFKLASAGRAIGRIVQDCEPAILARLGEEAPTFPCTVRIRGAVDQQYNYRVAGYWATAPMLTFMALYYSGQRWDGDGSPCTLDARAEVRLKGRTEPLVLRNAYTDSSAVLPALDLVAMPLDALLLNPYREVEIESVDYEVEVRPGFESALIEGAWVDRTRVAPGGRATVHVRLKQYRGEEETRALTLDVPETARPGSTLQILVCDAVTNRMIERGLDPGFYDPRSLEDLIGSLTQPGSNRDLVLRASVMDEGLRYDGAAMPALPPSARGILTQSDGAGRSRPLVTDIVQRVQTPWVIEGALVLTLTVKEREAVAWTASGGQ